MSGPARRPTVRLARLLRPGGPDRPVEDLLPATDAGWTRLLSVADGHRLVPALAAAGLAHGWLQRVPASLRRSLADRGESGRALPEVLLLDALDANRSRTTALLAQGREVLAALDGAGIPAVPLKGLDALLAGRFPDPAARTMTDLDVLVPADDGAAAWGVLRTIGFEPVGAPAAEHHLAPLARPGQPGSVELHTSPMQGRWRAAAAGADLLARSGPDPGGGPGRRLHPDDAALLLAVHAQLQDESRRLLALPLRALHETALLVACGDGGPARAGAIDWAAVVERVGAASGPGARRAVEEHLWLTARLFALPAPVPVGPTARAHGRLVAALADHRRARTAVSQLAFVPRSFRAERMVELHGGPDHGPGLWATRARHAAAGLRRRVGWRPPSA